MIKLFRAFIDFLYPPRCLNCGKIIHSDNSLCHDCFSEISFITKPYCAKCGTPLYTTETDNELYCVECLKKEPIYDMSRAAIKYDEHSKRIILAFKFADRVENKILLSKWLYLAGKDIFDKEIDFIIPVPLHFLRRIQRKYNQSIILARELSKLTNLPVNCSILKKIKKTKPQVFCNKKNRSQNIKNAFKITHSEKIKGKSVVLIDDVYTTGSTTRECTKVLKKAGAKAVYILTVAKVCKQ